ncbi:hypothetical protein BDZ85DRAFT_265525 [Elsinoe ampelina]|uniref:Secreted protein n=1 Tax=Elsinoe ampelina TaxID=302913 RepID=A0A6A6G809_9PEZI|nr:hypothetical protein BDZ85DRAFT_265525 [Elsinoe ampelina]
MTLRWPSLEVWVFLCLSFRAGQTRRVDPCVVTFAMNGHVLAMRGLHAKALEMHGVPHHLDEQTFFRVVPERCPSF